LAEKPLLQVLEDSLILVVGVVVGDVPRNVEN
jgi:hypothetical protein